MSLKEKFICGFFAIILFSIPLTMDYYLNGIDWISWFFGLFT
jgi:hypothetical protein